MARTPAGRKRPGVPRTIALPEGFAPEGIAPGRGSSFYAGNIYTGRLLKGDYRSGAVVELAASPAPAPSA